LAVAEHPDLILMDLEMPDDDRWEAVRRLKNDPQTRDIPIIGVSAHAVESERETAIAMRRVRRQTDRIRKSGRNHPASACEPQIGSGVTADIKRAGEFTMAGAPIFR
jgi:CheY-like chemotaxis protein